MPSGHFSVKVQLVPGSNVFTIVANDTVTQRDSAQQTRTIEVDLSGGSPSPAPQVALTAPTDGATLSGAVALSGSAPAGTAVHVEARLSAAGAPGFSIKTFSGQAVKVPAPAPGSLVAADATAGADGTFSATLMLTPGTWQISAGPGSATPSGSPAPTASPTTAASSAPGASISVKVTAAANLTGTLVIAGGPSYLLVLQDNVPLAGISGRTLTAGKSVALSAKQTLVVRAGNASAVTMTINGITIGTMGGSGEVIEWHVQAGG